MDKAAPPADDYLLLRISIQNQPASSLAFLKNLTGLKDDAFDPARPPSCLGRSGNAYILGAHITPEAAAALAPAQKRRIDFLGTAAELDARLNAPPPEPWGTLVFRSKTPLRAANETETAADIIFRHAIQNLSVPPDAIRTDAAPTVTESGLYALEVRQSALAALFREAVHHPDLLRADDPALPALIRRRVNAPKVA